MAILNDLVTWYIQNTPTILNAYVFLLAVLALLNERKLTTMLRELAVLQREIEHLHASSTRRPSLDLTAS
jgi:hypothetical protein